jgi:hypothetical protein
MKRNLIALAVLGLTVGTNAALADNNDVFADAYWSRVEVAHAQTADTQSAQSGKYDQVDRYNP